MNRVTYARLFSLAVLCILAACTGGASADNSTGGNFVVLRTEPETNGHLFLNDPIRIDFSNSIDLDSVDLNTFSFQVFDQLGNGVQENVSGEFRLARSPGDEGVGRRLEFVPIFPTNDTFDNGGFRPGRTYFVQLVGGTRINGTVLRDSRGKALLEPISFRFSTADGTQPSQLFRDLVPGGPRRVSLTHTPVDGDGAVVLNKFGQPPVEIRLGFDQPLLPSSSNLPVAINLDPLTRSAGARGGIFLEYDDPVYGDGRWIPAEVELETNALEGASVLMTPLGILPNNAEIRVIVASNVADISGESNVSNQAYSRVFGAFRTSVAYEQQFDAVIDRFDPSRFIDVEAAFAEPMAEVGPGYLKAGFAFEGVTTNLEYEPLTAEVVLDTEFTMVTPKVGVPYNVSGGIFNFSSVHIPQNVHVQGTGANPMVWLVSGRFVVDGTLSVRGGNGERGTQIGSANIPKAGGFGACGGGTGGDGSPSQTLRSLAGGTGNGPLEAALQGGVGGNLSSLGGCGRGSGGGGGSFVTQGDPNFPAKVVPTGSLPTNPSNPNPVFVQQLGIGGPGCVGVGGSNTRSLPGGAAGSLVFADARVDNDFWGVAVDNFRQLRIEGELSVPVGGGGGGAGGDLSYNNSGEIADPNFSNDSTGGGGGGGGGVLIVKALDDIVISSSGRITADGGSGGAGEVNGSSSKGGGGGGGAGGMVILMSATKIDIHTHGGNFANNNYDFAISADGGISTTTNTSSPTVTSKYPANGQAIATTTFVWQKNYDSIPLGGFGGMGIVQLMAPPGDNSDNTNTTLDDNIRVLNAALVEQTGQSKMDILAWRGHRISSGSGVDDGGNEITIGDDEGDIRPSPLLMPVPFAETSRVRSIWIDTGSSARRALATSDELPRGVITSGGAEAGPRYSFGSVDTTTGYASYVVDSSIEIAHQDIGSAEPIRRDANDEPFLSTIEFLGEPAYQIELANAVLGSVKDLYAQNDVHLLDASGFPATYTAEIDPGVFGPLAVSPYRILSHTDRFLTVSAENGPLPDDAVSAQIRTHYFEVVTGGDSGLGPTDTIHSYFGSQPQSIVPRTNVRIGFAFHQDPSDTQATRYPTTGYAYDLSDPAIQEAVRTLGASFVQYDILFTSRYRSVPTDSPPPLDPDQPRPELHWLRLPFKL